MSNPNLRDIITYDPKKASFVITENEVQGHVYDQSDVNALLAQLVARSGRNIREIAVKLAAALVEPIDKAIPYATIYSAFYNEITLQPLEDPALPVESNVMGVGWEVHGEAQVFYVRPSLEWYRPTFKRWSTGVKMPWEIMEKAGWNIMQRMMARATDALARKIDLNAKAGLDAAIATLPSHQHVEAGATLTKATVDAAIKAANTEGFPIMRVIANSGTATDMSGWTTGVFGTQVMPAEEVRVLLQRLYLGNYGGANWETNVFVPARFLYCGGSMDRTGFHIVRGSVNAASDVDITKGVDLHAIRTAEHAFYVDNAYNLRRIHIQG